MINENKIKDWSTRHRSNLISTIIRRCFHMQERIRQGNNYINHPPPVEDSVPEDIC